MESVVCMDGVETRGAIDKKRRARGRAGRAGEISWGSEGLGFTSVSRVVLT